MNTETGMRISYDPEADALSIVFLDTTVTTQELAEGIIVEYDQDGCLAGIEILNAATRTGGIDSEADVLYVNFRKPSVATDSEITDDDIIIRYDGDEIVGYTILHASQRRAVAPNGS